MANKFYDPGVQRAAKVQDLFSTIAPRYDLINDLQSFGLHRYWKRRLITLAAPQPGQRLLDVCCGTGDVALRLAAAKADVVGVDFSAPMLERAHMRSRDAGAAVTFVNGDALRLPFAEDQFDVVTVSYGLRNLAAVEEGLREMHRVAKPGGRLLVLDFGKPPGRLLRAGYFAYLRYWVPVFGRLVCGDSATYGYILESLRHYPAQEGIASLMHTLRCRRVQVFNLLGGVMSINYGEKQL
jgi:demethylmenaquinone methyltransferase/2-methoxy-6-polyprenyl-1,4-benzoquinol methylase